MSTENMEAPEIYSGKVGVEIVPDMRKLRSFAKDFIALVDSYWPEETGSPLATHHRHHAIGLVIHLSRLVNIATR